MVARITRSHIRSIFPSEPKDFTPWLTANIDVLNDVVDLSLTNAEREQTTENFSADIVAEDERSGMPVVIESQFDPSNHDHLGKLLTYLASFDAKAAIWIVPEARPEHVKAIVWLNESRLARFYLVQVDALRINDSESAPLFTLIVGPSDESRQIGEAKEELSERFDIREKFWAALLERAKGKTKLHAQISPSQHGWIGASAGWSGLNLNYVTMKNSGRVELYIDRGKDSEAENKALFGALEQNKPAIETAMGSPLKWERLEARRACRISLEIPGGGYRDPEDRWPAIQDAEIDAMIRLEKALRPYLNKLPL